MEERQLSAEEIAAQLSAYQETVDFGKAIEKLIDTPEYKLLKQRYVDDYALGQLSNAHNYADQGDKRFLVAYKSRANFMSFINESIQNGQEDAQNIIDFKKALEDEGYGEI